LLEYAELILQAFTFYASLGAGDDIFSITRNAYLQFVRDLSLVNLEATGQRDQDLQLIFESANASAVKGDPSSSYNQRHALSRYEWVGVLVQLLLVRYVVPLHMGIEASVRAFFEEDLLPSVPNECVHSSNAFRADYCYQEQTDLVLRMYESSLRAIYTEFAFGTGAIGDALLSTKLMDVEEFNALIGKLDVVDECFTAREVRLTFLFSRMLIVDETSLQGRIKTLQLGFEDFLEVVVRLAFQLAMPTDDDVAKLGLSHAGEYMQWLGVSPEDESAFKQAHSRSLAQSGRGDRDEAQPIAHKVRHFIEWMLFAIRGGASNDDGGPQSVDKKQVTLHPYYTPSFPYS